MLNNKIAALWEFVWQWTLVVFVTVICWGIPLLVIAAVIKWALTVLFGG